MPTQGREQAKFLREVHTGTRIDALKYALGANANVALKRSPADKRNCVAIAMREFSAMSDRAIAEMCGISHHTVGDERKKLDVGKTPTSTTRTDTLGRQQPAHKPERKPEPAKIQLLPEPVEEPGD